MKNILIGMAGHIDHGKTTLIKALTGKDMDSLPEEKKRGMTIDIAFTDLDLDGSQVGLIDVPGHEKFIKNMSAGVSGINFVILVIACNDGIMPQTVEHFEIIKLLGIKSGIVVLTKRDLVSEERYHEVVTQCNNFFKETFLENSICSVSPDDLESYTRLKSIIKEKIGRIDRKDHKRFRLNIDRVFSVKGFGTVVTGTIISGKVSVGDSLTLYPQLKNVRVKNIQNHGKDVEYLESGKRCAINLANIEKDEIKRGDVLAHPDSIYVSDKVDTLFYILPENKKIKNNHRVRIDIGTDEVIGRIIFLDRNFIVGGDNALAQLKLETPISGQIHDIGIVRDYSPVKTIGSIKILNIPSEMKKRFDGDYNAALKSFEEEDTSKLITNILRFSTLTVEELTKKINEDIESIIKEKISEKEIFKFDRKLMHRDNLFKLLNEIKNLLESFHKENHLELGLDKNIIRNRFLPDFTVKEFNLFLELSEVDEIFKVETDKISLKDYKIKLSKEEKTVKESVFSLYKNSGFTPLSFSEILENQEDKELFTKMHRYMAETRFIIHLDEDFYILKGFLKESIKIISEYLGNSPTLSVASARALLNCNRDSAILILRKLDELKVTKQINNIRVLIK